MNKASQAYHLAYARKEKNMFVKKIVLTSCIILGFSACGEDKQSQMPAEQSEIDQQVQPSLIEMNLSRTPSHADLIAAGQLGGLLSPTDSVDLDSEYGVLDKLNPFTSSDEAERKAFGQAIQDWNKHSYKEAYQAFDQFSREYPESPWKSEAILHMGCEARFNGRYSEARTLFEQVIAANQEKDHFGAKKMLSKARSRLAVLEIMENNPEKAKENFRQLKAESEDWRLRTYASHWLKKINSQEKSKNLLDCGTQALSAILKSKGDEAAAKEVLNHVPGENGFNIEELISLSNQHGVQSTAIEVNQQKLESLPLPAILQVDRSSSGGKGHYWVLEAVSAEKVTVFDPQMGRRFTQSPDELAIEWKGNAILFDDNVAEYGRLLTDDEQQKAFGGCCGIQRPESDLGDPENDDDCSLGAPVWDINMINMNMYVNDIPLWHKPAVGPSVQINLSYNSQSAIAQNEPFGNKWMFNYSSYIVVDPADNLTLFATDGARINFTPDIRVADNKSSYIAGYTSPPASDYSLTLIKADTPEIDVKWREIIGYKVTYSGGLAVTYRKPEGTKALQFFITDITDINGHSVTFTYDSQARMQTIIDAEAGETKLIYNDQGLVERVDDPYGRSAHFEYDQERNLIGLTDMQGYTSKLGYDDDKYITFIEDAKGKTQFRTEPADGDSSGGANSYPPFGASMWENYRITVTDPLGAKEEYYYDGYHGNSWYVNKNNYNEAGNKDSVKTLYSIKKIDSKTSRINKVTYPDGSFIEKTFDNSGQMTATKNHLGQKESYTYGAMGQVATYTDVLGQVTRYTYAPNNIDVVKVESPQGTTTLEYNALRQVVKITDINGGISTMIYNTDGQLSSMTDSLKKVTQYHYNPAKRLSDVTVDGQQIARYEYDKIGRVTLSENLHGQKTLYSYNDLNSLLTITTPDGEKVEREYGQCPRMLTKTTLPGNRSTQYNYDADKKLVSILDAAGGTLKLDYDKNGDLIQLTDQNSNQTKFKLNAVGELTEKQYNDGSKISIAIDKGTVNSVTNARGQVTTYTYNDNHMIEKISYSDGTPEVTFAYNSLGQVSSITDSQGTHAYTYNANGSLKSYDSPLSNDLIEMSYDIQSRPTQMKINGQDYISYSYDSLNRIDTINAGGQMFNWLFDDTFSATSLPKVTQSQPNGVSLISQLNAAGQVASRTYQHATESQVSFNYQYNELGGIASIESSRDELVDPQSKEINQYNQLNQLVKSSSYEQPFTYDLDGNMTAGYLEGGERFSASYNADNRLVSISFVRNGVKIRESFEYFYSGFLARYRLAENEVTTKDIRYLRLGLVELQERDAADAVVATNWWHPTAPGGVGGLLRRNEGGIDYYANYDHNGNIVQVTNGSGQVISDLLYATYGKTLQGDNVIPFGFSTKPNDFASGFTYSGYRFYLPHLKRWLNRDPIGLKGGLNTYTYVDNNPVNAIDALGLCPCGNPADVVSDAVGNVGSTDWSYYKEKGRFPKNTNKCNLFVEDTLSDNGFNVPDMNGWFSYNGPTAGQWGDPSVDIPGYPVVTNPQPGDIIAIPHNYSDATGHVGIVTGPNTTASHSSVSDSIQNNDWGHRPGQSPVYRRCQCP